MTNLTDSIPPNSFLIRSDIILNVAGRSSSVRSVSAWHVVCPGFDPHVWHIPSWRFDHVNIYTTFLPLSLIQEGQVSDTGNDFGLSTGKLPRLLSACLRSV